MPARFCGVMLEEVHERPASPSEPRLSKQDEDALILQFMYWQDAGARPLPLVLGEKHPGEGWRTRTSPTVEVFADLVRANQTHGIGVPLTETDVVIDIEGRARPYLPKVMEAASHSDNMPLLFRVVNGLTEETPTGGLHIHLRVLDGQSRKHILARGPQTHGSGRSELLVEMLGYGQQVVVAPSGGLTHVTGRGYRRLAGAIHSIAAVTSAELTALCDLFRRLDATPQRIGRMSADAVRRPQTIIEIDFNARVSWEEILIPKGWTLVRVIRGQPHDICHWSRPGKRSGTSATSCGGTLCIFSTSTDAPAFEPPAVSGERGTNSLSKFEAFTFLHHGGDRKAALSAAHLKGYGDRLPQRRRREKVDTGSAIRFLSECLASATTTGSRTKQEICDIADTVVPRDILLLIANRERRATGRQTITAFGPPHEQSRRWACERASRHAIEILVQRGQAQFDPQTWVLSRKMEFADA
jgi:hypothetical protein